MIADVLRQMGIGEPTEASAEAVVRDGKIAAFTVTNPTASAAAEARAQHGVMPAPPERGARL